MSRHHLGPDPSSQQAFAQALLDPDRAPPQGLRTWNGSDPAVRLAVYRNNMMCSLVEALAQTFPVTQQLVGSAFFRAMASLFVRRHPPTSCILASYGAALPGFMESFEPAAGLPYLPDMARLEFARVQAYHAADAQAIDQARLAQLLAAPEQLPAMRLALHPSLQTMASRHSVVSLWQAHQQEGALPRIDISTAESALVLRLGLDVLVAPVPPGMHAFVAAVASGAALGAAAATAAALDPAFDLAAAFARLLSLGAICAFHAPGDRP